MEPEPPTPRLRDGENDALEISARDLSGCRQQVRDALLFIPILVLSCLVGLGILILNFWLSAWSPTLLSGILYLLAFACVPLTAMTLWRRWAGSARAANVRLILLEDELRIVSMSIGATPRILPLNMIKDCRFQDLRSHGNGLEINVERSFAPSWSSKSIFVLCAAETIANQFVQTLKERVAANRKQG